MENDANITKGTKLAIAHVQWNNCKNFIKKVNGITKASIDSHRKQSENMYLGLKPQMPIRLVTRSQIRKQIIKVQIQANQQKQSQMGFTRGNSLYFTICMEMYGSGARIDLKLSIDFQESLERSSFRVLISPTWQDFYYIFRLARTAVQLPNLTLEYN